MAVFRKSPNRSPKINPYSYYKSSVTDQNKNRKTIKKNTPGRLLWRVVHGTSLTRILIVLIGIGLGLYLMSASTDPIVRFSTSDVIARDASTYRSQIHNIIQKSIFNRSKLLFDYRGVESSIKEQFPEIGSAQISFDLVGRRPVVKIQILKPAYIFQTNGLFWVIDTRGVSIGLQSELNEAYTSSLQTVIDEVGTNAVVGTALMSAKQTNFLTSIILLLEKQLVIVEEVYIPPNPKEIDIRVASDIWRYKLSIDEPPAEQAGTLLASRATLKLNNDIPSEYVDLRTSEKVFWK